MGKAKRQGGRPTKLQKEVSDSIERSLALGSFRKAAALQAGISFRTFLEWMELGKERPTSAYGAFRAMVTKTEASAETVAAGILYRAATTSPKWALAWLRVRHRARWNPPEKMELTGKDGGPIAVSRPLEDYTDEELADFERIEAAAEARRRTKGEGVPEP